jgi:CHAT domain-containing protein/tetratricopeptide (TPR) repeat protein
MARHRPLLALPILFSVLFSIGTVASQDERPVASTLAELQTLLGEGKFEETLQRAEPLLADAGATDEELETAEILDVVAHASMELSRIRQAHQAWTRALAIRERLLGAEHPDLAETLYNLAYASWWLGEIESSTQACERALAIIEKARGRNDPQLVGCIEVLSAHATNAGDFDRARSLALRNLALTEALHGTADPEYAASLMHLAGVESNRGEFAAGQELLEQARAILKRAYPADHPSLGQVEFNLGTHFWETGDYAAAERAWSSARDIWSKAGGPDDASVLMAEGQLARLLTERGDFAEARALLERKLPIERKRFGPEHRSVARTLLYLADLESHAGNRARADARFEEACDLARKTGSKPLEGLALMNRGRHLARSGRFEDAAASYAAALVVLQDHWGAIEHPFVARAKSELADVRRRLGDTDGARLLIEEALTAQARVFGRSYPEYADSLTVLAALDLATGRRGEALAGAVSAAEILEAQTRSVLRHLPARQSLLWIASRSRPETVLFEGLLSATEEDRAAWLEACWRWTLSNRALVLEELAGRNRSATESESPAIEAARREVAEARTEVARLWARGTRNTRSGGYGSALEKAEQRKERAEAALAELTSDLRAEGRRPALDLGRLRDSLPRATGLVEIVRVQVGPPAEGEWPWIDVALVIKPDGEPGFRRLGSAAETDTRVARWTAALRGSAPGQDAPVSNGTLRDEGERLRRVIWDPVLDAVGEVETLLLVPDGSLHWVDWRALPASDGTFLVERGPVVHLLDSGRDAIRFASGKRPVGGKGLLALGNPDFDAGGTVRLAAAKVTDAPATVARFRGSRPQCDLLEEVDWTPLPESEREVRTIGRLVSGDPKPLVLTGAASSEERFKREAAGKRILHLATHGFFLGEACSVEGRIENPLLLSGLALAGANRLADRTDPVDSGADDGLLTAEEIAALDLSGVELAVLSACESGLGVFENGEGVFGLRHALEQAGVRSVVMSLWRVPDREARRWMSSFYERRLAGAPVSDAAGEASLSSLRRLRERDRSTHPYLWAGFVTAGDWH